MHLVDFTIEISILNSDYFVFCFYSECVQMRPVLYITKMRKMSANIHCWVDWSEFLFHEIFKHETHLNTAPFCSSYHPMIHNTRMSLLQSPTNECCLWKQSILVERIMQGTQLNHMGKCVIFS